MQLTKLKLENYKQFKLLEIDLKPGLNCLIGRNEAGKSTLSRALLDAFFTAPSSKKMSIMALKSWHSETLPRLELEFKHQDTDFILCKDFEARSAKLHFKDKQGRERVLEGVPETQRALEKILPLHQENVFSSTAYISADDLARLNSSDAGFVSAVQNIAVEGEGQVQIEALVKTLDKRKALLLKGTGKWSENPGPIQAARNKVRELANQLEQLKSSLDERRVLEQELINLKQDLSGEQQRLQVVSDLLLRNKTGNEARKVLDRIAADYERVEQELELRDKLKHELETLQRELAQREDFAADSVLEDLNTMAILEQRVEIIKEQLKEAEQVIPVPQVMPFPAKKLILSGLALVLGILLGIALQSPVFLIAGIAVAVAWTVYVFFGWNKQKSAAPAAESGALLRLEEDLRLTVADKQKLLGRYSLTEAELRREVKAVGELANEVKSLQGQLKLLEQRETTAMLTALRQKLVRDQIKQEEILKLTGSESVTVNPREFAALSQEEVKLTGSINDREHTKTRLETRLGSNDGDQEQAARLEEALELAQKNLDERERDLQVIELIIAGLKHAVTDTATASAELVEKEIGKYLPELTSNRYSKVRLNNDLSLSVYSPVKKDWCDPKNELSRGTLDQIYFLARLAFIRLLCKPGTIPVFMDDPFLTFDGERLKSAIKILNDFAKDYQVLLFSFNPVYSGFGTAVLLDRTTV